ncbi:MAG: PKD domain-containing protein [Saprospiraceae bacterium]
MLGCSANLCKTLTVTNADDGSITYPTTLSACLGSSVTLQHSGDVAGYTFSWSPTTGLSDSTIPNPSFTFSGAIDYVVTITDPITGCSFNRSVSVTGLLEPTPSFTVSSGCSQGLTMNFISTSTNAATYSWDFGVAGTNTDVSNLANPTYTFPAYSEYMVSLTVTSADGCSETFTTPVTVSNIPLQADFDINYGDCGDNSVMVQFTNTTINGANNTTAYSWAFSNGTPNSTLENPVITVTSSQTITALLTVITADGCVSTASQTFDVVLGPPADQFPATITVCQGVPSQITPGGNPAYSYLWSPGTGINDILSPQPIFSPTTTTLYTVTITSIGVDTCEVVETVEVVVPPSINLQIDGGGNYCTPTATLTATADVPVTFNWYNANGSQVATGPSYTPSVSGISTFTVEAIDASGCSETQNVTISGGPVNIAVPDTVAICLGEEVNLFVTNLDTNDELTYLWEPANLFATGTTTSPTPDFLEAIGTYEVSVTVTNQFGCSTQENIHVAVLGPNLTLSFESLIDCNGGTVVFTNTSSNAFGYVWNFGDGSPLNFDESPIHTYAEAGLYTVTLGLVYDVSCATTFSMDIMVEAPQIFADFTYDITECGAETAVIQFMDTSTNSLDNTIAWEWTFEGATPTSSMEQNPSVTVNGENPVTATLTIFTANDCQNSHTETLTVDLVDLDIAMTDTLVVCLGESVTLNEGGDGSLSYAWSPVATLDDPSAVSPVATPSETTTYYVTAFSTVGSDTCFVTDSVVVFVPTEIELELDQMPVVITCGEDVVITATANVDVTVNWFSTTDGAIGTGAAVTVNPFRQDTIIAIATDIFGCTATDTIIIIDNGVDISVMGGNEQEVCRGVPATLTVENLDTEDELTYEWMPMEFIIGSNTGASVQVLVETEGTFTFTAMVTNQHDCIDTVEVSVTVSEFDGQVEDMVFVCAGEPTAINPDGIPTLVYEWTPVDDFIDLSNPWNPVVTTSEPLTYMVNVTDPVLGCTFMDTVQILIHPAVNPVIAPQNVVICDGSDITLTATGDAPIATVTWYLADDNSVLGTGNPFTFSSPLGSHEIIAETVSENGCTERDTVVIHNQPLDVTITNELIICEPIASTELEVINNDPNQTLTVNWAPEGVLTALDQLVVTVDPNVTGSFSVAVSNQFGCTDTLATTVTVIDLIGTLAIDAAPDTILLGESTTITVSGCTGCDYIWDITTENSSVIVYSPDETGEQFAFVNVNLLGCEADLSTSFFVIDATCDADHIFFPNAFTPNNDGDNDELRVRSNFSEELTEMELLIYNRWGEEMFRTTNIYDAWDGTHRGEALPPDVYGYYLRVLCPNGDELIQKGNVTLLR